MGVSYWMLPRLTGRALIWPRVATLQPYLWFAGMQCFSIPNHIAGVLGMPRRVYTGEFQEWRRPRHGYRSSTCPPLAA